MISTRSRSFRALAWANLAAHSAEQLGLAAAPILAVVQLGAGPSDTGLLATAQTLPFLLLSVPLGLLADRVSRRTLMVACETLRALTLAGLLAAAASGHVSLLLLATLGFLGAVGTVGFMVATPSLVPAIVPRAALGQANSTLELARSAAFAAGPAAGGALVSWAGASSAFVLATVISASCVALLLAVREPGRQPAPARRPLAELRDGARLVFANDLLRPVLATAVVWNIAWFVLQAAFFPYAIRLLGLTPAGVGLTLGMYGAGMVCGALLAPRLMSTLRLGDAILVGPFVSVIAAVLMALTIWMPQALLAGASFFLFGAGPVVWSIASTTLRQAVTPQTMLGRVSAIFLTFNAGARPLGAALGALTGGLWDERACLLVALAGFAIQALVIAKSRIPKLQALPTSGLLPALGPDPLDNAL